MFTLCHALGMQLLYSSVSVLTVNHNRCKPFVVMSPRALSWAHSQNVKSVYLRMSFIKIIGVIKVEHLWAKCNTVLAGFLWTTAPLVFKYIGLKTLHHLDPCDTCPSLPGAILCLPHSSLLWLSTLSKATSPYLWFTFISLTSFYLLGHFTFGTYLKGNCKPLAVPWHPHKRLSDRVSLEHGSQLIVWGEKWSRLRIFIFVWSISFWSFVFSFPP